MTDDRIENAQREIQRILPSKPEYLVTTSEFLDVKERFARLVIDARDKKLAKDGPQLRRAGQTSGTIDPRGSRRPTTEAGEEDGPPVLRRKDDTADAAGESTVESGAETESVIIQPPAPGSQQTPEPATQQAPPAEDDPDRPILKRKNLR